MIEVIEAVEERHIVSEPREKIPWEEMSKHELPKSRVPHTTEGIIEGIPGRWHVVEIYDAEKYAKQLERLRKGLGEIAHTVKTPYGYIVYERHPPSDIRIAEIMQGTIRPWKKGLEIKDFSEIIQLQKKARSLYNLLTTTEQKYFEDRYPNVHSLMLTPPEIWKNEEMVKTSTKYKRVHTLPLSEGVYREEMEELEKEAEKRKADFEKTFNNYMICQCEKKDCGNLKKELERSINNYIEAACKYKQSQ